MHKKVQQFFHTYQLFEDNPIQQIQLQHRYALAEAFKIERGMRVLEIGCGQGDTTVVLADLVGEEGHVTAIDIASGDYGAPLTLSQAHEQINQTSLGNRITFQLETDFLTMQMIDVDIIVLSHCTWYFTSKEQLLQYLLRMKQYEARVCIAEWDLAFENIGQRGHFCAASILALYSAFVENDGNIQQAFSKEQIVELANEASLKLIHETSVDAHYLQDGSWEKAYANEIASDFTKAPATIQTLVRSYYDVMNGIEDIASLNSFVVVFE